MKCPLLAIDWAGVVAQRQEKYPDCLKEDCAWWIETQDRCAVKDLALSLGFISVDITQGLERKPPARE